MSSPSIPLVMSPTIMSLNAIISERRKGKGTRLITLHKGKKNIAKIKKYPFFIPI